MRVVRLTTSNTVALSSALTARKAELQRLVDEATSGPNPWQETHLAVKHYRSSIREVAELQNLLDRSPTVQS